MPLIQSKSMPPVPLYSIMRRLTNAAGVWGDLGRWNGKNYTNCGFTFELNAGKLPKGPYGLWQVPPNGLGELFIIFTGPGQPAGSVCKFSAGPPPASCIFVGARIDSQSNPSKLLEGAQMIRQMLGDYNVEGHTRFDVGAVLIRVSSKPWQP